MKTFDGKLRRVMVERDGLWHDCRLGDVKAGEIFILLEDGVIIAKAIAAEDGKYDHECGGKIIAESLPLDLSFTVPLSS